MMAKYTFRERINLLRLFAGALVFVSGIMFKTILPGSVYIPLAAFAIGLLVLGGDIVLRALRNIVRGQIFDENFLMSTAAIGAFASGESAEAVAVMLFYQIGEFFQERAVKNSKRSITKLMDIRPDYANLKKGEGIVKVAPDSVHIGDSIIVKPGERIPLDGIVVEGSSFLDASALTGESVPLKAGISDTVLSGCINLTGVLTVEITKISSESTVSKIINLVENASAKKAKTENFITSFARYYTPVVVILAVLLAALPPLFFGGEWRNWINRGLIFLVVSCPCALVLSVPMSFFAGLGKAAKKGILIKGGNFLEALNYLDTVVFDKTGTLTKGVFKVTVILPASGVSDSRLLEWAAHAETFSNHPIAMSIMQEYGKETMRKNISGYTELAGYGVSINLDDKEILAGNKSLMTKKGIVLQEENLRQTGEGESHNYGTNVYVAADGVFAGRIVISDEVKPDSAYAVSALKARGVKKTVMLSGDSKAAVDAVAALLKLDEAYGVLLPHEKVEKLEELNKRKKTGGKLAFVGDGINDAPVLAMADIGIAMGGLGSDAAIEAADAVIMTDEPSKLTDAIDIARFTKRIVWQNIVFALGVKAIFLLLGALGIASVWGAVFADVGVSVLAVLNAMRITYGEPVRSRSLILAKKSSAAAVSS